MVNGDARCTAAGSGISPDRSCFPQPAPTSLPLFLAKVLILSRFGVEDIGCGLDGYLVGAAAAPVLDDKA
jgi:hypothetical protein